MNELVENLEDLEDALTNSRKFLISDAGTPLLDMDAGNRFVEKLSKKISNRYANAVHLINDVKGFQLKMAKKHQPVHKLYEAIVHATTSNTTLDATLAALSIEASASATKRESDSRVTSSARLVELKVQSLLLDDKFEIIRSVKSKAPGSILTVSFWGGGSPGKKTDLFLQECKKLFDDCIAESLPEIAVEATLYYARIAQPFGTPSLALDSDRARAMEYRKTAQKLLEEAKQLCDHSFRDRDTLLQAVLHTTKMLSKEFYEEVSKEELAAIKKAMVSGRGGIATQAGHWYNCVNGYPVSPPCTSTIE